MGGLELIFRSFFLRTTDGFVSLPRELFRSLSPSIYQLFNIFRVVSSLTEFFIEQKKSKCLDLS